MTDDLRATVLDILSDYSDRVWVEKAADRLVAAFALASTAAEGEWVLVPKTADDTMAYEGFHVLQTARDSKGVKYPGKTIRDIWTAMIAAAPNQPANGPSTL